MPPNQMTGRMISEVVNMPFKGMQMSGFQLELLYSFVIILASLMIYFGTREIYKISSYKGLKYFRLSFLFFAIAYFFRYAIKFTLQTLNLNQILEFSPRSLGPITLFAFMYFSSIAIFFLLYSVIWKKASKKLIYVFHLVSLIISSLATFFPSRTMHLSINIFLFILTTIIAIIAYLSKDKKKNNLFFIYFLLFLFWILNIIDILIPNFLVFYQIYIYLISITIFLTILYKVLRKTGN